MTDFVLAEINGESVSIPLGLTRPKLENFYAFEQWITEEQEFANSLKMRLESGEILPHSIEQEMANWSERNFNNKKINSIINTEKILLFLDVEIKMSLRKDYYNIDQCLGLLQQLMRLNFTPLMLKKNPEIVKTIERVTRFNGNGLDRKKVKKINKYAFRILKKIHSMFDDSDQGSFLEAFKREEKKFHHSNLHLNVSNINMMVQEP